MKKDIKRRKKRERTEEERREKLWRREQGRGRRR